jgi:TRAP transporter TAXI family solute receptor
MKLWLVLAGVLMTATAASAQSVKITLGTATPGGGFPVYGEAFIKAVQSVDPAIVIEPVNTRGSTENVPRLEAGTLDIALVQGEVIHESLSSVGRAPANIKVLWAMYSGAGMFVVRADSPYKTIDDLKGTSIAWGAAGSGLTILGRYVMDGMGLDAAKDFTPVYLEKAGDGPAMVLDGRVAALWGGGTEWPGFKAVTGAPGGGRFIAPNATEIERVVAKHKFLKKLSTDTKAYAGQGAVIPSVGSWSFVMVRPGLDEALVHRLAEALHKAERGKHHHMLESTAANTASGITSPDVLHPGVARYLSEIGALR